MAYLKWFFEEKFITDNAETSIKLIVTDREKK